MNNDQKIPLIITKNSFSIILTGKTAEALLQQPRPILWNNDGLYCWVSLIRVKNQANIIKDKQIHAEANDLPFAPEFCFSCDTPAGPIKEMAQAIELMLQQSNNNGSNSGDSSNDKSKL